MGSPEAKGQPARPKGAVPARVGVFRHQRLSLHAPPQKKQTHRHSHRADLCQGSHALAPPPRPRRNTHCLSLRHHLVSLRTSYLARRHGLSHLRGNTHPRFPASGLWPVFLRRPHPLLLHRSGGNNLEGPAFRQSSGSCCLSSDQTTDSRGEGRGCQTRGTLSMGPEIHLSLVCSSNTNSPFSPLLEWVRGSQCS